MSEATTCEGCGREVRYDDIATVHSSSGDTDQCSRCRGLGDQRHERDAKGALTDWALACDALADNGCDCGEDEPGTCLGCLCERAMRTERERAFDAEAKLHEAEERRDDALRDYAEANKERHTLRDTVEEVDRLLSRMVGVLRPLLLGETGCMTVALGQHELLAESQAWLATRGERTTP